MQGIIESLDPERGQIDWTWVGGVFAFYVLAVIGVVGMVIAR